MKKKDEDIIKLSDGCFAKVYKNRNRIDLYDFKGQLSFIMSFEDLNILNTKI